MPPIRHHLEFSLPEKAPAPKRTSPSIENCRLKIPTEVAHAQSCDRNGRYIMAANQQVTEGWRATDFFLWSLEFWKRKYVKQCLSYMFLCCRFESIRAEADGVCVVFRSADGKMEKWVFISVQAFGVHNYWSRWFCLEFRVSIFCWKTYARI